ncbi:MAG: epoxyqueuosine reductase QueH [Dehalococcoidales bacterium]|nr:epoxyqueuosine reductase QueH [Dehalococcoidales bacterium]
MNNKSVLIHCCCAHCTAYTVKYWQEQGYEATALWYNPNIHPYMEHQSRLEAMKTLSENMSFNLIVIESYDFIEYFRRVVGHEDERCALCFDIRLNKTAETAIGLGIKNFTSTLLISHQQKHDLLKGIGEKLAQEFGVDFLYADLRKRYSDSRHITKPMDLYRQQYCGCVYSEWERYTDKTIERSSNQ